MVFMEQSKVYVVAGPNGAGKTTFSLDYLPSMVNCHNFINADLIAGGLNPLDVASVEISAGKLFLARILEQIDKRADFSFETTLSGLAYVKLFRRLKSAGYVINLFYLWIPDVGFSAKRVQMRVENGGHDIPPESLGRRYSRSLKNLFRVYTELADYTAIFDNAGDEPRLICEINHAGKKIFDESLWRIIARQTEA